jgi:2'-5' RNA ligase
MDPNHKRLFFGMDVKAPWPESFPAGRLLDPDHRHMTLTFLGNTDYAKLQSALSSFPNPPFKLGLAAKFDQCLFFPERHPHVVAWHITWLEKDSDKIPSYYQALDLWLKNHSISAELENSFLPHVTIARSPFNQHIWKKAFSPLPVVVQNIHLYESIGHLRYIPLWSLPLLAPFEEFEHTADLAYRVRGEDFNQLYAHGAFALCFSFVDLLPFLQKKEGLSCLEEVIIELNHLVTVADQEIGCPFKAVSFHSHLSQKENLFEWEMIIDV